MSETDEIENLNTTDKTGIIPRMAVLFGDPALNSGVFTCGEADLIADFLVSVAGDTEAAARFLVRHGQDDEDPDAVDTDDLHYGLDHTSALAWALGMQDVTPERPVTTAQFKSYDHDPRPDDMPEPGDRCKDCGEDITWHGHDPEWLHVLDVRNS